MRRAFILPPFAALAFTAVLVCPAPSRGDGGLFGSNTQDRQRWFVSPTVNLSSTANTPNPSNSYFDKCFVTCPANDSVYTVVVRDAFGNLPVPNADVVIDFSPCGNVVLAEANPPGQYQLVPFDCVLKMTNSSAGPISRWPRGERAHSVPSRCTPLAISSGRGSSWRHSTRTATWP